MRSDSGPMAEVQKAAVKLACRPGILDVSPFGGFAYADTPAAGAGIAVTATAMVTNGRGPPSIQCVK